MELTRHRPPTGGGLCLLVTVLLALLLSSAAARPASAATPEQIDRLMQRGVDYVYRARVSGQPHWETTPFIPYPAPGHNTPRASDGYRPFIDGQWGGNTAMAVYALLAAGENPRDEKLAPSVRWLLTTELRGVYVQSVRLLVCSYLPPDDLVRNAVRNDASALRDSVLTQGNASGHWDYITHWTRPADNEPQYSHSRSQYALLGLDTASNIGFELPPPLWRGTDEGWRRNQNANGGWGYKHARSQGTHASSPGMTASAVASLYINQRYFIGPPQCNGNPVDRNIAGGLAYLAINEELWATGRDYPRNFPLPTLYAVERVGVASGLRYIGGVDWFDKGARWLVGEGRMSNDIGSNLRDTCFAMIFLSRGSSPVVAQKLAHADSGQARNAAAGVFAATGIAGNKEPDVGLGYLLSGDWHQRPLDLRSLAEFMSRAEERELHWQILTPDRPLADWLDAPLLVISGSQPPRFSDEVKTRLREFVNNGGMVYFNADCGSGRFAGAVRSLGEELFPGLSWGVAATDGPLYTSRLPATGADGRGRVPPLLTLSNGSRDLLVLADRADLSEAWQRQITGHGRAADQATMHVGVNLVNVTIDRDDLRRKGVRDRLTPEGLAVEGTPVRVGRLTFDAAGHAEPAAWTRAATHAAQRAKLPLTVSDLAAADLSAESLAGLAVVHIAGTGNFTLTDAQRAALVAFADGGGIVLVEAVGGSTAFAEAAERELAAAFGADAQAALATSLPLNHPLYAARGPLKAVDPSNPRETAWKLEAFRRLGAAASRGPRLRGIARNNRLAIVYSPDDLSSAAAGSHYPMIGYKPDAARELLLRVALIARR